MRNNVSESLDRACAGHVLPERNMHSHLVIIDGIFRRDSAKVLADPWSATAYEAKPMRCQRTTVSGLTMVVASRMRGQIEPNEQGTVDPTQMQSAWYALLQDIELMPQYQDCGVQPPERLEAVAQHAEKEEGNCNHAMIML